MSAVKKSAHDLSILLAALRRLSKPPEPGMPQVVRRFMCVQCEEAKTAEHMNLIPSTGVVGPVLDCVCHLCAAEWRKNLAELSRVVCATCRETVFLVEPHKEKTGFTWKPGGFYHVSVCPCCSSDPELAASPIAEKIAFYKANGIPYA